jgi:Protein kinase domain
MTKEPLATGLRASGKVRDRSARDGHETGAVTALEPSEPSRGARRRLRVALAARAAIDHPNLVRVWAVGEGDGRLFVAFERCPHPGLSELLAAAPLEPTACARVLDGAAAGVGVLSERALVARNLMPERVLVDPEHGGVLMDLGIPRELLRTVPLEQDPDLAFRSPEELERKPVDGRSSVYSLGALLFTTLTGRPPADYSSRMGNARPRPSDQRAEVASDVDAVIARAMARDPAERYANPEALARAAAVAVGLELAPRISPGDVEATQRGQQPPEKRALLAPRLNGLIPRANGCSSATAHPTRVRRVPPQGKTPTQPAPGVNAASPRHADRRPALRRMHGVTAHLRSAARRCVAVMAAVVALAGTTSRRGRAGLRRFAAAVAPVARSAASVAVAAFRRAAHAVWALFLGACHLVVRAVRRTAGLVSGLVLLVAGAWRRDGAGFRRCAASVGRAASGAARAARCGLNAGRTLFLRAYRLIVFAPRLVGVSAVVAGVARRRAVAALLRLRRSASSLVRGGGGRTDQASDDDLPPVPELIQPAAAGRARSTFVGAAPMQVKSRRSTVRIAAVGPPSHRKLLLIAVGAIVASVLSGIMLKRALEPEVGPSSITRSGLTVRLPPGWKEVSFDAGRPAVSSAIAAAPPEDTKAGFVVGKLRSEAAAERMLEGAQRGDSGPTEVRLGKLDAWRYAGLRPRPQLAGTGYLLPTTGGAVVMVCHASREAARIRLAECDRAATTLVVRGEGRPSRGIRRPVE